MEMKKFEEGKITKIQGGNNDDVDNDSDGSGNGNENDGLNTNNDDDTDTDNDYDTTERPKGDLFEYGDQ